MGSQPELTVPPVRGFRATTAGNARELLSWDIAGAILLSAAGALWIRGATLSGVLASLLMAEFGLIGALLGIVIAGLAIIVGYLSSDYALVLMRSRTGPAGEFWPFWYVAALAACSILASAVGLLLNVQEPHWRRAIFTVTSFLASYALLAAVNLVAFVKAQGETRAYQLARRRQDEDSKSRISGPGPSRS